MGSEIITDERDDTFRVAGLTFRVHMPGQPAISTSEDEIVILKAPHLLRKYDAILGALPSRHVLEVGVFEGGSVIYFALAYPHLNFISVDLRDPSAVVQRHVNRLGLGDRVALHYHIDQGDTKSIHGIIRQHCGDAPLGAVIEDASHFYGPSKKTFEGTFGLIAPGGVYCLEDWAWAHEPGPCQSSLWMDQAALSNLLFEIVLLQPSVYDFVRSITIDRHVAFVERGAAPPVARFNLDDMILNRGRRIPLI